MGVANGLLAYVGKTGSGDYKPLCFNQALMTTDIEFSEEMFLITKETAEAYLKAKAASAPPPQRQNQANLPSRLGRRPRSQVPPSHRSPNAPSS